jgi:hypothetical protein
MVADDPRVAPEFWTGLLADRALGAVAFQRSTAGRDIAVGQGQVQSECDY